jgi:type I restriction enzyme S subunit
MDRKVTRSEDRSKYKAVQPGDLAYNMMRAWQGGFGAVTVSGQVSPAYVVARPFGEVCTAFVEQLLRTPHAVEQMRRHSRGVTDFRLRLYWEEFKNIRVALPPLPEQQGILDAVATKTAKFDSLIGETVSAIELLKERRAALISAAVTGKIDVRDKAASNKQDESRAIAGLMGQEA